MIDLWITVNWRNLLALMQISPQKETLQTFVPIRITWVYVFTLSKAGLAIFLFQSLWQLIGCRIMWCPPFSETRVAFVCKLACWSVNVAVFVFSFIIWTKSTEEILAFSVTSVRPLCIFCLPCTFGFSPAGKTIGWLRIIAEKLSGPTLVRGLSRTSGPKSADECWKDGTLQLNAEKWAGILNLILI